MGAEWDEDLHPRDESGRFSGGGGGGAAKAWAGGATSTAAGRGGSVIKSFAGEKQAPKVNEAKERNRRNVSRLDRALKTGLLPGKLGDHVREAKTFIGQHKAGFQEELDRVKSLAPADALVKGRTKDLTGALEKIARKREAEVAKDPTIAAEKSKYASVKNLQDCTGIRVVTKNVADLKSTIANIQKSYEVIEAEDYVDKPQAKPPPGLGYRSFHFIVRGKDGLAKEFQLRTPNQHKHAEWCHDVYKPRTTAQLDAMKRNAGVISQYSRDMSDYFYQVDSGKQVGRPPCPKEVAHSFGCM